MKVNKKYYFNSGKLCEENYYKDGKLHRVDGPALILIDGELHRTNGPAQIYYNLDGTIQKEVYWLNDRRYDNIFIYSVMVGNLG